MRHAFKVLTVATILLTLTAGVSDARERGLQGAAPIQRL